MGIESAPGEAHLRHPFNEGGIAKRSLRHASGYVHEVHRWQSAAPVILRWLGTTSLPLLPKPLAVPFDREDIAYEIERSLRGMALTTRWVERLLDAPADADFEDFEYVTGDAWALREESPTNAVAAHPHVVALLHRLSAAATERMPRFIRGRYRVSFRTLPPDAWTEHHRRLAVVLTPLEKDEEAGFPLASAAAGLLPWVQLAILEGIEHISQEVRSLATLSEQFEDLAIELSDVSEDTGLDFDILSEPHAARLSGGLDDREVSLCRNFQDAVRALELALASLLSDRPTPAEHSESHGLPLDSQGELSPLGRRMIEDGVHRSRTLIIDEPERHLHARAERTAALWLADRCLDARGLTALVATHSPVFMTTGDPAVTHLWRSSDDISSLEGLGAASLHSLTAAALNLGLDRGQLLTQFDTYLFVEGETEVAFLDSPCGRDLLSAGVCVLPTRGAQRARGIFDVGLLSRYTSATLAVWLDKVSPAVVEQLGRDPSCWKEIRDDRKAFSDEERTVAEMHEEARLAGRLEDFVVLPNPAPDVFDLLSNDALGQIAPRWPGHEQARREAPQGGQSWKQHYSAEYGLEFSVATVRRAASLMKAANDLPSAVKELLTHVTSLRSKHGVGDGNGRGGNARPAM